MREVMRTSDPVLVSFVEALLKDARIAYHIADVNTSSVEGTIGIFPRRVLVASDREAEARDILTAAGLGSELIGASGGAPTGARKPRPASP